MVYDNSKYNQADFQGIAGLDRYSSAANQMQDIAPQRERQIPRAVQELQKEAAVQDQIAQELVTRIAPALSLAKPTGQAGKDSLEPTCEVAAMLVKVRHQFENTTEILREILSRLEV